MTDSLSVSARMLLSSAMSHEIFVDVLAFLGLSTMALLVEQNDEIVVKDSRSPVSTACQD